MKELNISKYVDRLQCNCYIPRTELISILKNICNDVIDICAEEADADFVYIGSFADFQHDDIEVYVLKESILKVKEQIV